MPGAGRGDDVLDVLRADDPVALGRPEVRVALSVQHVQLGTGCFELSIAGQVVGGVLHRLDCEKLHWVLTFGEPSPTGRPGPAVGNCSGWSMAARPTGCGRRPMARSASARATNGAILNDMPPQAA